jgi:hypothetical protein
MVPGLVSSGTRPTDLNSVSTWLSRYWNRKKAMTDRQFYWWRFTSKIKHWFGIHAWVPLEDWKHVEDHGFIEIIGYSCWHCPARKGL